VPLEEELAKIAGDLRSHSLTAWQALRGGCGRLQALREEPPVPRQAGAGAFPQAELERTLALFDTATAIARRCGLRETIWQAHLGAARAWRLVRRFRRAHNHLEQAVEVLAEIQAKLPSRRLRRGLLRSGGRADVQAEISDLARAAGV
jgi:hypothetical protein